MRSRQDGFPQLLSGEAAVPPSFRAVCGAALCVGLGAVGLAVLPGGGRNNLRCFYATKLFLMRKDATEGMAEDYQTQYQRRDTRCRIRHQAPASVSGW